MEIKLPELMELMRKAVLFDSVINYIKCADKTAKNYGVVSTSEILRFVENHDDVKDGDSDV